MKKIGIITCAFAAIFALTACDEINEPYTKGTVLVGEWSSIINNGNVDSLIANADQKVLIEDYTGFTCGNCPNAAVIAGEIAVQYPGKVFIMGVHAGSFAAPKGKHLYDFRTEVGTAFDTRFDISANHGNPNGLINRTDFSGSKVVTPAAWKEAVESLLKNKPLLAFTNLKANLSSDNKSIKVDCAIEYMYGQTAPYYLGVYILEDSIVQYQTDYSQKPSDIYDYVHKHVLRAAVNGTWGEIVKNGEKIYRGEELSRSYTYTIPEGKDWRLNKLKIIAFVYNSAKNYEIVQVGEAEVK